MTDNEKKALDLIKSQNEQIQKLKATIESKGKKGEEKKSESEEKIDFVKEIENLKNQLHTLATKPKDNKNEFDDILEAMKKA